MKKYALIILMAVLTLSGCTDTSAKKSETLAVEVEATTAVPSSEAETESSLKPRYKITSYSDFRARHHEDEYEDDYDEYEDDEEDSDDEYVYHGSTPISDYADDSDYLDEFDIYSVDSTCFDEIGYNYYDGTLYVRFLDSQKEYLYLYVPEEVFDELYASDSPGSYYNKEIKGQYDCERLFY